MMISRKIYSFLILASILLCINSIGFAQQQEKPNVIFIIVDDYGWMDVGAYGSEFYETPNIDKLAKSGIKFSNAYTASPVCSPTRASIMTGKYPSKTYNTDWFGAPQPWNYQNHWTKNKPLIPAEYSPNMALEEYTLAEAFQDAGYKTFFAGKWHLGETAEHWPEHQGFDINIGGTNRGGPYGGNRYFSPYDNPRMENGPEGEYLPLRLAQETASFIDSHKNDPFLAYLSFYSVHTPLMTTEELELKYLRKRAKLNLTDEFEPEYANKNRTTQAHAVYAGMVEAMDTAVGLVLESLERNNLLENTIIVFFSDNGGLSTAEGSPTSNLPLRAGKGWLYEGGIRVPLIFSWKGQIPEGIENNSPVISMDFYPTLIELAGLNDSFKGNGEIDGFSLSPLLQNQSGAIARDALYWHYPHYGNQGGNPGSVIQEDGWKLIYFYEDNRSELYNLKTDIGERNNLILVETEKADYLKAKLMNWLRNTKAALPKPNIKS
ncbi:Arylsulfatase A [Aquiflexum balticum DSM 16537]|uniref:Arylsulfatase A n=1 Tax=Aquiflexum balticum DSM 16537 TaxID=758820 RepID=A0A1W2H5Y7_9BACT|nr:sulfatase [Aquiflexum balticum]SMD44052.1 Arylsulfatase A [Aquiflexum balticum DSM 16537]